MPLNEKEAKSMRSEGPLEEAWPIEAPGFHGKQVGALVLDYVGEDIDDEDYTPNQIAQFSLFSIRGSELKLAHGVIKKALAGHCLNVEIYHPSLLTFQVAEIKDPQGRTFACTNLFRAALASFAFNPIKMKPGENDYGLVERLASLLRPEQVDQEIKAQFPPGWKANTDARMQKYYEAVVAFGDAIIAIDIPASSQAVIKCKEEVENYRNALKEITSHDVISMGLLFDFQILLRVRAYYHANINNFGGCFSDKTDLFWVVGYGSLLKLVSSADEAIVKHGLFHLSRKKQLPLLPLKFSPDLGETFFMDDHGGSCSRYLKGGEFFADKLVGDYIAYKMSLLESLIKRAYRESYYPKP